MQESESITDVIVVGSGGAGMSTAIVCALHGLQVVLPYRGRQECCVAAAEWRATSDSEPYGNYPVNMGYRAASLTAVTCRVKVPMMGGFPFDHLARSPTLPGDRRRQKRGRHGTSAGEVESIGLHFVVASQEGLANTRAVA